MWGWFKDYSRTALFCVKRQVQETHGRANVQTKMKGFEYSEIIQRYVSLSKEAWVEDPDKEREQIECALI